MKILLVCAAGMSTSLLVNNMKKFADAKDLIEAYPVSKLSDIVDEYDIILVGPQIRYQWTKIEKICNEYNKKSGLIDMMVYGRMDGEIAMKQAKKLMGYKEEIN